MLSDRTSSPSLEAFLTTSIWTDRVLGSSKSFTGEKYIVLFITGNSCTVSPDMRRRSLFVELFMREERAEQRQFKQVLDGPLLLEKRGEILSALWAMVKAWDEKGRPPGSKTHSSYPEWTRTIAAIVENAGYRSPVEMPTMRWDVDRDDGEMRKLVNALPKDDPAAVDALPPEEWGKEFTFAELVQFARKAGAFEWLLSGDSEQGEIDRKARTTFSRILSRYDGRSCGDYEFVVKGAGHSRRYAFRKASLDPAMPKELK